MRGRWAGRLLAGVSVLALCATAVLFVVGSGRGFDVTDEASYLLSARAPEQVTATTSQYGHYTGLLYELAGGIRAFRLLGAALLVCVAALFARAVDATITRLMDGRVRSRSERVAWLGALVAASMTYYAPWIPTPSYNWLDLVACLVLFAALSWGIGLPAGSRRGGRTVWLAFAVAGAALGIAALTRTPTALALAPVGVVAAAAVRDRRYRPGAALALIAGGVGVLLVHVAVIESSPAALWTETRRGHAMLVILRAGYDAASIVGRFAQHLASLPSGLLEAVGAWWMLLLLVPAAGLRGGERVRVRLHDLTLAAVGVCLWSQLWLAGAWSGGDPDWQRIGTAATWLLAGMLAVVVVSGAVDCYRARGLAARTHATIVLVAYAGLCWLGALAFGLGSNNGTLTMASFAFVLLAAGAAFLTATSHAPGYRPVAPLVVAALVAMTPVLALRGGWERPYRLVGTLSEQLEPTPVGANGSVLMLDGRTREYVRQLESMTAAGGWRPGTPLFDLTGGTPGAALILGARAPVVPWVAGGYAGSDAYALRMLEAMGQKARRAAWILRAPTGEYRISDRVLDDLGLEFPHRYELVGRLRTGYRDELQELWKPRLELPD